MKKEELKKIFGLFSLSRIPLIILIVISLIFTKKLGLLNFYDGANYIEIAKNGYSSSFLYAFFPLYPLLVKTLAYFVPYYGIVGMIISNIFSYLSLIIIYRLIDKEHKKNIFLYLCTPILVFTSIVYTESMFLFLTLLTYYLYRNNKYILTSIVVGLSILTRNTGILLLLAIGIDIIYRKFFKKNINISNGKIIACALIGLGIGLLYPMYLYFETGNLLMFINVQGNEWGRQSIFLIGGFISDIKVIIRDNYNIIQIIIFLENWISYIFALILGIKLIKKDLVSSIYILLTLVVLSVSFRDIKLWNTLSSISMFRYVFGLFPLYLFTNIKNRYIILFLLIISSINCILFGIGAFIA